MMDMYAEGSYRTIGELIGEQMKTRTPTAESLRAAAKVLEEKAKELDKPRVTPAQSAALVYADEHCLDIIDERYGSLEYHRVAEEKTKSEGKLIHESFYSSTANQRYHPTINVLGVSLRTFVDDDNCVEVAVVWPK